MKTTYELRFKIEGMKWRVFDKYKDLNDPDIKKYYRALSKSKYNDCVKVVKIEVSEKEVDFDAGDL